MRVFCVFNEWMHVCEPILACNLIVGGRHTIAIALQNNSVSAEIICKFIHEILESI